MDDKIIRIMRNKMYSVTVLMSSYNGETYLKEQIDSILSQEGVSVQLLIRDDGSKDRTQEILNNYQEKYNNIQWYTGKNLGPAKSFMDLVLHAKASEYYAFSDQDDVWMPDKLYTAVKAIENANENGPILYYSATTLVDSELREINNGGYTFGCTRFENAVISSNCTGCTMCFNSLLKNQIAKYSPSYQIMHDGWVHKVCLAIGGHVVYDSESHIYYRQHGNNVIGGSSSFFNRIKRRAKTIRENRCPRSRGIIELYDGYKNEMSNRNREICLKIIRYKKSLKNRMILLFDRSIYSPSLRVDCLFRITVLLGLF